MRLHNFDYQDIIRIQREFNNRIFSDKDIDIDNLTEDELHSIIKDYCLHTVDEIMELLREINWKMHKKKRKPLNRENVVEELVDISKFFFNFLMILGITEDEFVEVWNKKTEICWERYGKENEKELG